MLSEKTFCHICHTSLTTRKLCCHLRKKHNLSVKDYYIKYNMKDENEMFCNNINCNNETKFIGYQTGFRKYCCRSCQSKSIFTKEIIEKANKTKAKWFASEEGQRFLKSLSENRKGDKNPRYKRSKEDWLLSYKKQSNKMKENIAEGKFTPCVTNSWANSRCKIEIDGFEKKYRSTWEAVFQILNPTCKYEKLRIKYISPKDNEWHNYIVDFIDEVNKKVYEVKPNSTKNTEINIIKEKYLLKWCYENNYTYNQINDDWFFENAKKLDYNKYDNKINKGMKQFL